MVALWPGSFQGRVEEPEQWRLYFADLLLNGLLVGLPEKLGRFSTIQPAAWYARLAVAVHNAIVLYGVMPSRPAPPPAPGPNPRRWSCPPDRART